MINTAKNNLKNLVTLYPVLLFDNKDHQILETIIPNDTIDNLSGFNFLDNNHKINFKNSINHVNYFVPSLSVENLNFDEEVNHLKIDVDGNDSGNSIM